MIFSCYVQQTLLPRNHPSLALWVGENEQVPPDDINRALKNDLGLHPYFENSNEISKSLKLYLQCQKILANILMVHVFTSKDPCGMDLQM